MRTILVVDDEALVRLAIKSLVDWQTYGYALREAGNGAQALEVLDRESVDLVLTDLRMPGMDGFGLLEAMKGRGLSIPVVVLSAHNDYENVRRAFKLGACDYIVKTEMRISNILATFSDALSRVPTEPERAGRLHEQQKQALWALLAGTSMDQIGDAVALGWQSAQQFVLLVAPLNASGQQTSDPESRARLTQGIQNLFEQTLKPFDIGAFLQVPPDAHCVLLTLDACQVGNWRERTDALVLHLKNALNTYFNFQSAIGVSSGTAHFEDIPGQYQQALRAVKAQQSSRGSAPKRMLAGYSQPVASALLFMQENYAEEITLKTISDHVFLSESYFSALFSKEVKASFTDTLMGIRIQNAKTLLETTTMKAYEVAARVGFVSAEHFHRVFKKMTGCTPHAYRNGIDKHQQPQNVGY